MRKFKIFHPEMFAGSNCGQPSESDADMPSADESVSLREFVRNCNTRDGSVVSAESQEGAPKRARNEENKKNIKNKKDKEEKESV